MLDCPDACGMIVEVRDGRAVRITGDPSHPTGQGFLCARARKYLSRLYHPDRVLRPLRRRGSDWVPLSWEEAIDLVATRIRDTVERYGSLAILHYQGAGSFGISKQLNGRLFNLLGGVTTASGNLCIAAIRSANALCYGASAVHEAEDAVNSRLIVLWGKNPAVTSVHTVPVWLEARRRGIPIVLIDPLRSASARFCDLHLQLRPASDRFLALGIARVLLDERLVDLRFVRDSSAGFDEFVRLCRRYELAEIARQCDLPVEAIVDFARMYGARRPAAIHMGRGAQRSLAAIEAARLIIALAAMTGNIGVAGGGVSCFTDSFGTFDLDLVGFNRATFRRAIPKPTIAQGILDVGDPPIKLAWIAGSNVVAQTPNPRKTVEALGRLDFVVVVDQFLNDTAQAADVLLPCTTFLEEEDIRISTYHNWISASHRVVEPLGESKPDWEIVSLVARTLGIDDDLLGRPVRDALRALARPITDTGMSYEELVARATFRPGVEPVAFRRHDFRTPSGKFEFIRDCPEPDHAPEDDEFPLYLLTPKKTAGHNSQFNEDRTPEAIEVRVSPEYAGRAGLRDGDAVWVVGRPGRLRGIATLDPNLRSDVVVIYQGGWLRHGRNVNVLIEDRATSDGLAPAYYETRVRLEGPAGLPA